MQADQRDDNVDLLLGKPEAPERSLRDLGADLLVPDKGAVAFRRPRLADVVEQRPHPEQEVRRRRRDREQGMAEHVVGVVAALGDALAGRDLRQDDLQQLCIVQQLEGQLGAL